MVELLPDFLNHLVDHHLFINEDWPTIESSVQENGDLAWSNFLTKKMSIEKKIDEQPSFTPMNIHNQGN